MSENRDSGNHYSVGGGMGLALLFLGFWGEPDLIDCLIAFLQSIT